MKRLTKAGVALAATGCLVAGVQPAAEADSFGTMTTQEYVWVDYTIPDAHTQQQVEAHCVCDGIRVWTGTKNGNPAHEIAYDTPFTSSTAYVYYVLRDGDEHYKAYQKFWCSTSGGCVQG